MKGAGSVKSSTTPSRASPRPIANWKSGEFQVMPALLLTVVVLVPRLMQLTQ